MKTMIYKMFEGQSLPEVKNGEEINVSALEKVDLDWLRDLDSKSRLISGNQQFDQLRGPRAIIAKLDVEAVKHLGKPKPGWYLTDIPIEYYGIATNETS